MFVKNIFLLLLICCAGELAYSQDFVIKHNLLTDKTSYFKVSKPTDTAEVKLISIKKQGKLTLNVENYNPYYWNAKVTAVKIQADEQGGNAGLFNPFSVLTQGLGGLVKDLIPGLDIKGLESRGVSMANDQSNDGYIYWAASYQETYNHYQKLVTIPDELKILKVRLEELKYDNKKPAVEIKQRSHDAVKKILETDKLDFEDILEKGRGWNDEFSSVSDSLNTAINKLNKLYPKIDRNYHFDDITLGDVADKIKETDSAYRKNKIKPDFFTPLTEVANVYKQIQSANFNYSYTVNAANDYAQLKLQIYSRKDTVNNDTITRYFPIRSKGNLRLRNSVGISFTYFSDKNKSYFVKPDSTIGGGSADYFTPLISTFIHFYGYKSNNFKIGGAIGFGIPVTGDKKDINYMLGICGVIGKNEPIMVTLGVAGAKVRRLSNGWSLGTKAPRLDFDIPTLDVFRVGVFLGVSFNLGRMSVSRNNEN